MTPHSSPGWSSNRTVSVMLYALRTRNSRRKKDTKPCVQSFVSLPVSATGTSCVMALSSARPFPVWAFRTRWANPVATSGWIHQPEVFGRQEARHSPARARPPARCRRHPQGRKDIPAAEGLGWGGQAITGAERLAVGETGSALLRPADADINLGARIGFILPQQIRRSWGDLSADPTPAAGLFRVRARARRLGDLAAVLLVGLQPIRMTTKALDMAAPRAIVMPACT